MKKTTVNTYYRKVIKKEYREKLGLTEYKISLKKYPSEYHKVIKALFEVDMVRIYASIDNNSKSLLAEYNKECFKAYMKKRSWEFIKSSQNFMGDFLKSRSKQFN